MTVDRQEPAFQPYYASRVRSAYGHAMPPPMPSTAPVQPRWYSSPALLNLLADVLFLGAALAIAYVAVMWFLTRPLFPLREVVVLSPPAQVTQAQVEYAAHGSVRGNFFLVDLEEVREAFEKLPWVRRAEVRRSWPNALASAKGAVRPASPTCHGIRARRAAPSMCWRALANSTARSKALVVTLSVSRCRRGWRGSSNSTTAW